MRRLHGVRVRLLLMVIAVVLAAVAAVGWSSRRVTRFEFDQFVSSLETEIKGGETYYWCRCGRSNNQPFCDGSHKVTALTPIPYTPEKDETVYFCGCKNSGNKPFCDGTHQSL